MTAPGVQPLIQVWYDCWLISSHVSSPYPRACVSNFHLQYDIVKGG